ncbi:telomeric repeat-binding factor 1 isoform X1 [Carcharodon carcharias]|uniref:telomeric repeat-binding factor 1 isoform X1 n=1 Tax=Carcharodon carcharias TaxID=13397 RepID=UPI001B7F4EE9|nr:telomeric repeat-binding factor 1 isoform X1 [Carcharodon carcharias]
MEAGVCSVARGEGLGGLPLGDDFSQMVEVANGWMMDFMYYCLCRYFGAGMHDEFRMLRDAMNGFVQHPSIIETKQTKKVHICQILSRIVEGKNLDVQFDEDESITPLESALLVLIEMADSKELKKDVLYSDLKQLLQIQSVAVCMEKGDFKRASEVLERQFQENVASESDQPLKRKLSLIISKKDPCHKFLNNFSNKRLVDNAESLANRILNEKESNFLIQAATKVVQSRKKRDTDLDSSEDEGNCEHQHGKSSGDSSSGEADAELNNIKTSAQRSKRQLYSSIEHQVWKPIKSETVKDFAGKRKRSTVKKKKIASNGHLVESKKQNTSVSSEVPRKKRPWTWEEDTQLKLGLRRFGSGNWTKILEHYEFNNRTSVMLKDRWRTMKKLCMINSDDDT